jgi:serine/threonine-protein kinase
MIGKTIGKYRIVGHVGRGGAGIVYKAIDETLHREVAIKTLNPDLANTEVMKRFHAEATILAKLNHPHIATIYELFRSDADLLMVMEFVRGETLDRLAQRLGPMSPEGAAYLVDRMLSALEHAHREGVVHRDVKPANVMVTEGGGVKIMDFGIARVLGAEQMTIDGRLMGTPAYMPPEQVLGQEVDGRADLYSVGVVFYRLLTAALPFNAETALAMMQRQILEPPTPLHAHRQDLPEWCDAIVQRVLAKSADDRFQTAEAFREELRRSTGVLETGDFAQTFAIQAPLTETLDLSRVDVHATVPNQPSSPVSGWRKALGWANAAAAVAAIVAALGYVALQRPSAGAASAAPPPNAAAPVASSDTVASEETVAPPESRSEPATDEARPGKAAAAIPASVSRRPALESREFAAAPARTERTPTKVLEPPLVFETKTLVGTKKPREHDAQLVLSDGTITVAPDTESEYPFYAIPYSSVISITYSRGRDPMWSSPEGPLPLTRGGGALGKLGITVIRDWIALRTTTRDQFVAMRFHDVLIRRVLLALEERTGRKPDLMAAPKDGR